jgi:hypothetical protein
MCLGWDEAFFEGQPSIILKTIQGARITYGHPKK